MEGKAHHQKVETMVGSLLTVTMEVRVPHQKVDEVIVGVLHKRMLSVFQTMEVKVLPQKADGRMENIYKNLHSNQKILIYEMLKRNISVDVINEELELVRAKYQNHEELIYDRDSSIMPYQLSVLAGNKMLAKELMMNHGISVPIGEEFKAKEENYIVEAFHVINSPVVIKPVFGSHGYDVYMNLQTEEEIKTSLEKIKNHRGENTKVLIEEYYPGKEYRVFITKNRDYAVLHRDPAHVIGDGKHTIEELIEIENEYRMNPRRNALCKILLDEQVYKYLSTRNITINSIPRENEKVYLRENSNVAMGGICEDYTDKVDQSVIDIGLKVLEAFPGLPYAGIDYMTNTITSPQTSDSYRIIEINTIPGIDMHFRPAYGKSRNIAKYMVDLIFPETVEKKQSNKTYQKTLYN